MLRPLLQVPHERYPGIVPEDLVNERHRLPVQQAVDEVRPQGSRLLHPATAIEVLDVAKWQWPDRGEPVGSIGPQSEQLVATLLEREDSLRVVGQLTDDQYLQA